MKTAEEGVLETEIGNQMEWYPQVQVSIGKGLKITEANSGSSLVYQFEPWLMFNGLRDNYKTVQGKRLSQTWFDLQVFESNTSNRKWH